MLPARGQPLLGAPRNPALVSSLSPEGMPVSPTLGGMRSSCGPLSPLSLCPLHSCPHEAELEVAASAPRVSVYCQPGPGP